MLIMCKDLMHSLFHSQGIKVQETLSFKGVVGFLENFGNRHKASDFW